MEDFRRAFVSSLARKMVVESHPWRSGQQMICEDVEGKNINRAEKYIKDKHPEVIGQKLQNGTVITPRILTQEIRNSFKNSRGPVVNGKNTCKFLLGVTRIYFEDLKDDTASFQRKCSQLDSYLGIINAAHADEYDQNLNGLSFDELHDRFASAAKSNLDSDIAKIKQTDYIKNEDYEIVPIDSFEEAAKYGKYTSWCVTHYENMYETYTRNSLGRFYFCLKRGFEDVPAKQGPDAPMDEYGKSMIAISVNEDGSLNTCTCRWNHSAGGDDNMMDTQEISNFFGLNFYETFKPRGIDEIWERLKEDDKPDALSKKMGWLKIEEDDEEWNVMHTVYCVREGDRIVKYLRAGGLRSDYENFPYFCLAKDHFYWYNAEGELLGEPPEFYPGNFSVEAWAPLTSLEGIPPKCKYGITINNCKNLKDLSALGHAVDPGSYGIELTGCDHIDEAMIADVLSENRDLIKSLARGAKDVNLANSLLTYRIPFDDLQCLWSEGRDEVSFETCKKILNGDSDMYYDSNEEISEHDCGEFDRVMKNNGLDFRWSDICTISKDGYVEGEYEDRGISNEQLEEISQMVDDDFYEGMSASTIYNDCYRYGSESEAYEGIMSAISECIPVYGDKSDWYDGDTIKVSFSLSTDSFVSTVKRMWTDADFADVMETGNNDCGKNLILAYNWKPEDGDVDRISVIEPRYGWSGFDRNHWEEATKSFAYRIVKLLTGHEAVELQKKEAQG